MKQQSNQKTRSDITVHTSRPRGLAAKVTARETEIIRMLAQGLRNKEIGERFLITEGTVKIHLHNIYTKLGLGSRLSLVLYALDREML